MNHTRLKPIENDNLIQAIIETPAQSRNKFAFDPKQSVFALKNVLPAGMVFPYDFGFLPQTLAPDGDPSTDGGLLTNPAFLEVAVLCHTLTLDEKRSAIEAIRRSSHHAVVLHLHTLDSQFDLPEYPRA